MPKEELIRQIRDIALRRDTGLLSIVTDSSRAVLVRFSHGNIVGAHCRTKDIGEAIGVLLEAQQVRFAYAPSASEGQREAAAALMPVATFLELIVPLADAPPSAPSPAQGAVGPDVPRVSAGLAEETRQGLERLAVEIAGPIAQFLVEEALETATDLGDAVRLISKSIPDQAASKRFIGEAQRRFPGIG